MTARSPLNKGVWVVGIVLAVAAILVVAFTTRFGEDPSSVASPLVDKVAPDLELPFLEQDATTPLVVPGQVTVVNFWASWCIPCRAEHPLLVEAASAWGPEVRFVGVVYQDSRDGAIDFLDELGRGYDYVEDSGSRASIAFGVFGIPETFFVDREGRVRSVVRGEINARLLENTLVALAVGAEVEDLVDVGPLQGGPDE